ncbi:hypothetical protein [Anaerosporobacter sp.]|uniref:hypothetical protein n=1 Tax=Anaerosporobacter sp. TaxID=1872529 RepID=UPI00286F1D5B|nr:hypothetical protein [Anaerosporobacter sp.]
MAKAIGFIGVPSRDIVYYIGRILRICGQEVLVVTYQEEKKAVCQPSYNMGLDWLECSREWLQEHKEIVDSYSYVLYEVEICEEGIERDLDNTFDYIVVITNLYKRVMQGAAQIISQYKKQCILIVRDICNKRLDSKYFIRNYPLCEEWCIINEIWLDSYDLYYKQCLEFEEGKNFRNMSNDMIKTLACIVRQMQLFTTREIHSAIQQLKKGGGEC